MGAQHRRHLSDASCHLIIQTPAGAIAALFYRAAATFRFISPALRIQTLPFGLVYTLIHSADGIAAVARKLCAGVENAVRSHGDLL